MRVPASEGRAECSDRRPPGTPRHGVRAGSGQPERSASRPDPGRPRRRLGRGRRTRRSARTTASESQPRWRRETTRRSSTALSSSSSRSRRSRGSTARRSSIPSSSSGRLLVNLDGTSDGALTVGCAGSTHTFTRHRLLSSRFRAGHVALARSTGLGRSWRSLGGDIARGRVERDQGARSRSLPRACRRTLPLWRPRRWRQPKRHPARGAGRRGARARFRGGVPHCRGTRARGAARPVRRLRRRCRARRRAGQRRRSRSGDVHGASARPARNPSDGRHRHEPAASRRGGDEHEPERRRHRRRRAHPRVDDPQRERTPALEEVVAGIEAAARLAGRRSR